MLGGTTTTRSRPAMCIAKAASVTLASIEPASSSTSRALARRALAMSARSQSSFIRPLSPDSSKPINLFVSTERSTIGLLLQPVDTPSDAIVIREARDSPAGPARIERSSRHVRTMKNLLLAMAGDALPDDMEVREPGRELTLWSGARLTLQRQWLGSGVVGEKYQLVNTGASALELAERDLFKRGVMAVSVEQAALRPGETTQLFVIRERRADD